MICNPYILLSRVNTYLRDMKKTLKQICELEDDLPCEETVIDILAKIGYKYDEESNQFKKR